MRKTTFLPPIVRPFGHKNQVRPRIESGAGWRWLVCPVLLCWAGQTIFSPDFVSVSLWQKKFGFQKAKLARKEKIFQGKSVGPAYQELWLSGKLKKKSRKAWDILSSCRLCPRNCRVNRLKGERGFCGQGLKAKVARALPHFGEEPPLSGSRGAGTVFFSGCALRCLYCQNFQISQEGMGEELVPEVLAGIFLDLQNQGCHNLDLVSPTPHLPFIFSALEIAVTQGFHLPLVYNTHGYLSETTLELLEGVVDIFLPDMKYGGKAAADLLSQAADYPFFNQAAVREMYRQVGSLKIDEQGIGSRGLLVRHLILPADQSGSPEILKSLASISREIPVSLMAQYRPCFRYREVSGLDRPLDQREYGSVVSLAEQLGFEEIYVQDLESAEHYYPDFSRDDPFAGG